MRRIVAVFRVARARAGGPDGGPHQAARHAADSELQTAAHSSGPTLPNGLEVVLIEDARFPLVTARLNFAAGSKFDPKDIPGLSEAVATLLTEGTKTRTSRKISEETDDIGGSLNGFTGPDNLTVAGSALSENLPKLMALMADVAINASFPDDEVRLEQQNRAQSLRAEHSQPCLPGAGEIRRGGIRLSPYAHIGPTEDSIREDGREGAGGISAMRIWFRTMRR